MVPVTPPEENRCSTLDMLSFMLQHPTSTIIDFIEQQSNEKKNNRAGRSQSHSGVNFSEQHRRLTFQLFSSSFFFFSWDCKCPPRKRSCLSVREPREEDESAAATLHRSFIDSTLCPVRPAGVHVLQKLLLPLRFRGRRRRRRRTSTLYHFDVKHHVRKGLESLIIMTLVSPKC